MIFILNQAFQEKFRIFQKYTIRFNSIKNIKPNHRETFLTTFTFFLIIMHHSVCAKAWFPKWILNESRKLIPFFFLKTRFLLSVNVHMIGGCDSCDKFSSTLRIRMNKKTKLQKIVVCG